MQNISSQTLPNPQQRQRLRRWRGVKDGVTRYGVGAGGYSVIVALALIFIFLFVEVMPMLQSGKLTPATSYALPGAADKETRYLATDRFREVGVRYDDAADVTFFSLKNGQVRKRAGAVLPEGVETTAFSAASPRERLVAYGLSNGQAIVMEHDFSLKFDQQDVREVVPELSFPLGEEPVVVDDRGRALTALAVQTGRSSTALAAITEDNRLLYVVYRATVSFMTGEVQLRRESFTLPTPSASPDRILIDDTLSTLILSDTAGKLHYYDVRDPARPDLMHSVQALESGGEVTALEYLLGSASVLVGGSDGSVAQWIPLRDDENRYSLIQLRTFEPHDSAVVLIKPEYSRKGFLTADVSGHVAIHYTTSHRTILKESIFPNPITAAAIAPRNNAMLAVDSTNTLAYYDLRNHHPEISWQTFWGKVWYEGRSGPDYVWQSSSASDAFESKFSLVPLTLGTLKAAFYAMLFAIPIAVMGAIYTAYFMSARMRGMVKPVIEIMEALPTVILGFLAGLWLAPFVEANLPSVFSILLLMPIAMVLFAFGWSRLGPKVRAMIGDGWEAALLIPVILLVGWACISISPMIEVWFFDGSMRQWFTDSGITYDQRNALVVGIAMGFAVIPTIFSIAEDAVFNVPKHLTQGSLALGATPWQTMTRVVLLTASPGIFSAVMMGFGRAVGETMIVLMATGNSPVVNFNIFEGMRTLSANIAVEMPETAVGSTHYRILYLAALVLFAITFVVNTAAELVRQRLRKRYAEL